MWATRRVAGWVLLGITASLLELVLLRALFELAHWPLPIATAVAAEALIIVKFLLNDRFVFNHEAPTVRRMLRYHGASTGALAVYWLAINALSLLAGMPYVLAFVVSTGLAFSWSLITNFLWVWARPVQS